VAYDLVIRNGTIIDGSGLNAYRADVGISGGVITAIGRVSETGSRTIDAEGLAVTPGFIDGHTHMDAQVFWDEIGSCSCWHGVTTVVMGHCGFSLAPARADQRELVVRNLERAEDISGAAMAEGIDWTWSTFAEYLDAVDRLPKGINYAANIGHSALRTYAMGERAFTDEASTDDIDTMTRELADALHAGAIGFTSSRSQQHETSDNRPVASRMASWEEIRELVMAMARLDVGVFQLLEEAGGDAEERSHRDDRLLKLALAARIPFVIPSSASNLDTLQYLDSAAAAGARITGLSHCRGGGTISSFRNGLPFDSLPEWSEIRSLPMDALRRALQNDDVRRRLVHSAHHGTYARAIGAEARKPEFERLLVMDQPLPPYQSVASLARARQVDPVELMIDLALETDFRQLFAQNFFPYDHDALRTVLHHPRTVIAFSDAGAHVSQISDCSLQTHLLAYWVRGEQEFTLEQAVRMLTFEPARTWGFHSRGLLREGLVADINIFDPLTVAPELPYLVNDLPGGGQRFKQKATGIRASIVAGEVVHDQGEHTGALPGKLIRGPLAPYES
jgi:N-acyl-D-aspartate/D-glutamate deacylase